MNKIYSELLKLAPNEYPEVSVYNKSLNKYENKKVFRKYISYGVSPKYKNTGKSYMFNNQTKERPEIINQMLEIAKTVDIRFNNIYVNWYKDGQDFIEPHSDCIDSLIEDSTILILNFNEGRYCRTFKIQHKLNPDDYQEFLLENGQAYQLNAKQQTNYRHWIDKEDTLEGRISVTFRAIKE